MKQRYHQIYIYSSNGSIGGGVLFKVNSHMIGWDYSYCSLNVDCSKLNQEYGSFYLYEKLLTD